MSNQHILAKLTDVKFADIKQILKNNAPKHAEQGLFLEHLWKNADDSGEIMFLFRTNNLSKAKEFINSSHQQALKDDPQAELPAMIFLEETGFVS